MMNKSKRNKINRIQIKGDGNLVIQFINPSGEVIEEIMPWKKVLNQFLKEKDEQISLLKGQIKLSEQISASQEGRIIELKYELGKLQSEKLELEKRLFRLISEISRIDSLDSGSLYQECLELLLNGNLPELIERLDKSYIDREIQKIEREERKAKESRKELSKAIVLKAQAFFLKLDAVNAESSFLDAIRVYECFETIYPLIRFYVHVHDYQGIKSWSEKLLKHDLTKVQKIKVLSSISYVEIFQDDFRSTEQNLQGVLKLAKEEIDASPGQVGSETVEVLVKLASLYRGRGQLTKARKYFLEAYKLTEWLINSQNLSTPGFQLLKASVLTNYGGCLFFMANFEDAKQVFGASFRILQSLIELDFYQVSHFLANWSNDYSLLLIEHGKEADAIPHLRKTLELYNQILPRDTYNHSRLISIVYGNMGLCYLKQKDFISSLEFYKKEEAELNRFKEVHKDTHDFQERLSLCLHNQGYCFLGLGYVRETENRLFQALEIRQKLATPSGEITMKMRLAETYILLGKYFFQLIGDRNQALWYFIKSNEITFEYLRSSKAARVAFDYCSMFINAINGYPQIASVMIEGDSVSFSDDPTGLNFAKRFFGKLA